VLDWSTISPALIGLFSGLAFELQSPAFSAEWAGRSKSYTHPAVKTDLILKVRSIQDVGEDETRIVEVDIGGTPTDVPAQIGNRRIILEVRVESQESTDSLWAWQTVERIRTRLRRQSSLDALDALNFAIVRTGAAVSVPTTKDRRSWSVASMDITFAARFQDAEAEAANWIQSVEITSAAKDEADDPVPYTDLVETL